MKQGASNYVLKPFNNDELRLVVQRALGSKVLLEENTRLKGALENLHFGATGVPWGLNCEPTAHLPNFRLKRTAIPLGWGPLRSPGIPWGPLVSPPGPPRVPLGPP